MTSVHRVKGEVCVVGFIFKFRAPTKEVKLQMAKKGRTGSGPKPSACGVFSKAVGLNIGIFMM